MQTQMFAREGYALKMLEAAAKQKPDDLGKNECLRWFRVFEGEVIGDELVAIQRSEPSEYYLLPLDQRDWGRWDRAKFLQSCMGCGRIITEREPVWHRKQGSATNKEFRICEACMRGYVGPVRLKGLDRDVHQDRGPAWLRQLFEAVQAAGNSRPALDCASANVAAAYDGLLHRKRYQLVDRLNTIIVPHRRYHLRGKHDKEVRCPECGITQTKDERVWVSVALEANLMRCEICMHEHIDSAPVPTP